ncbi:protein kinase [Streptomyces sp. NPDC005955]|uniref:serine/threonine-protein kinase n=1 Tax=Streptomyces sp. NPDC005955 TaxID=3364738 RepID=UPI003681CE0A
MAEPGQRISDRYRLVRLIGTGGMGEVWLAHDELLGRRVAVKSARVDGAKARRRLKAEASNAGRQVHPHLVGVFDLVTAGPACWIVMEYVPGHSLARMVRTGGPLDGAEVAALGRQIADALVATHAEGVVHGDVTPENVLVTEGGLAKLTDFGISRARWREYVHSRTLSVRGKPPYLAPEVARGATAGPASDVFGLGATLYAAVEGRSPYGEADHPVVYVARAQQGAVRPPRRAAGVLARVLTALLAAEPGDRPDAAEASAMLGGAAGPVAVPLPARGAPGPGGRAGAGVPVWPQAAGFTVTNGSGDTQGWSSAPGAPFEEAEEPEEPSAPLPPSALPARAWLARRFTRPVVRAVLGALVALVLAMGLGPGALWWFDRPGSTPDRPSGPRAVLGEARAADPCALLDPRVFTAYGSAVEHPVYGAFDRCDVLLYARDEDGRRSAELLADIQVDFAGEPAGFDAHVPRRRTGAVTVAELPAESGECVRNLQLADGNQVWLAVEREAAGAPALCTLARTAVDHAAEVLNRGPVPERPAGFAAASLARVDGCRLLDAAALAVVPGIDPHDGHPDFARWGCDWAGDTDDVVVDLGFDRDNSLTDDGSPARFGGRPGTVSPEEAGEGSCVVRVQHRAYPGNRGERTIELVTVTVRGPWKAAAACERAGELGTAVARRLPVV